MSKLYKIVLFNILYLSIFSASIVFADNLVDRLSGKILLQVESNGEGWYIYPKDQQRYYLGRPADAFEIMRELGLGVSNKDFDSWNNTAPSRLSGYILLKVEDSGKAYYVNPDDLKMYYLGRPADAFNVMRELGLGISNNDLNTISIAGEYYLVTKVIDGDTIKVSINGNEETLRLIGIDTPESVHPSKPVEYYATEASNKAKELLEGKQVKLESDDSQGEQDKYGRLLRYVFLIDGTNFNKLMIADGYAREYTYSIPYKYQDEFKQTEQSAISNNLGLWTENTLDDNNNENNEDENEEITNTCPLNPAYGIYSSPPECVLICNDGYELISEICIEEIVEDSSFGFCGSKTYCSEMASCAEAKYFLNTCGLTRLDRDSDGVPCESLCN